ncbi:hypothetical protein TGFOU_289280B [Toxoplasma gondii FOU]|uniref:Uncharacterized protein n=2 Tax=Toxoplasma gondii TaxID=5811 RepID=A0A086L9H4_TOXGO|nr:hypothetical protein TGFOU_289280B [Toxoplasma gondii FOU]
MFLLNQMSWYFRIFLVYRETRPQGLNSLNHTAFVAYRDRAQRRLKGQKLEEGKESLEDISGELYGSVRLHRPLCACSVAVLCRVYPFFPELPPKQTDHLLLLLEFEFLLKSLFPNASTPSLSVSRTFHEQLTPPQLIDTLSETLRTPGMYIAQRYVPRSDTLLLALYHRPRPGCVLSHEWESLEMVPVPSLYEFLSFHRLSRDTEEYQTPTCLADLDRERHGNLRLLEQTLMPHDDSVISVATGTSGAGRLFPFPNLEKLEFEERLEQQQETEKLKRPRLRKHAEETDACTEVRREPRFCPEPLHASRCVSVTRPSTSSTFFLREDQAFAEACEELRVFLEAGVQASLALLAAPQGASQPGKEAAGKDREKEKTGLVSSSRQEPEESQKGPVVEDVDLARKNIFWLETASLASFVSHFEDQTRLHIAAHTVELMDAGRSGRTLLAEEVQNARAAVALTFPTGSVVQVTPDGSIWEGNDAALWKRLKQSYGYKKTDPRCLDESGNRHKDSRLRLLALAHAHVSVQPSKVISLYHAPFFLCKNACFCMCARILTSVHRSRDLDMHVRI